MAKITIEELSDSLKEYLNDLGLTEAQVQELINVLENEKLGSGILETDNKVIVDSINEIVHQSELKKQELVAALVAKGLEATTNMSFSELINSIDNIQTGVEPAGTAVVGDVLSGKTFINSTGNLLTGTISNRGSKSVTPGKNRQTLPAGYYSSITIAGDSNLKAENILNGITIFGITGTFERTSDEGTYKLTIEVDNNGYIDNRLTGTINSFHLFVTNLTEYDSVTGKTTTKTYTNDIVLNIRDAVGYGYMNFGKVGNYSWAADLIYDSSKTAVGFKPVGQYGSTIPSGCTLTIEGKYSCWM